MLRTEWTSVGDLRALTWTPEHPVGGVVLVDGSGEGRCDDWGGWAERIAELGVVVLAHDRPGCGGSPGDFLTQTLEDRADESLAALAVLRKHPAVTGPVGFLGFSQGGWVGMVAAARQDPPVDFLACVSGPGVGPAAQDRYRIEVDLRAAGLPEDQVAEGLAWIDERAERLRRGEDPESVLAAQQALAGRPWHEVATRWFDTAGVPRVHRPDAAVRAGRRAATGDLSGAGPARGRRPAGAGGWQRRRVRGRATPAHRPGRVPRRRPRPVRRRPGAGRRPDQPAGAGFLPMLGGFLRSVG